MNFAFAGSAPEYQFEPIAQNLGRHSLSKLEFMLDSIGERQEHLATPSMLGGVGAVGYRSKAYGTSQQDLSVEIKLDCEATIDQVVLVPIIYRDTKEGFIADAFPSKFRVILGSSKNPEQEHVVAEVDSIGRLLPRVAPVIVECSGLNADWVRIETSELSPRAWDGMYVLQFSEILVFSNQENLALQQKVDVSSSESFAYDAWGASHLVDGLLPYFMDASDGKQSRAYLSETTDCKTPTLTIDLRKEFPIQRVHFHTADVSDNVPQSLTSDYGVPKRFVIEGARRSDFSDRVTLATFENDSVYDVGPIMVKRFPKAVCRFVRFRVIEPYFSDTQGRVVPMIGIAELEIFSDGINIALNRNVHANFESSFPSRSLGAITDGNNFYGTILPTRAWLEQLALRHDLEVAEPRIRAELRSRYQSQSQRIRRLVWLAVLIAVGAAAAIGLERFQRNLAIEQTRERLAADLHDELGANLHAIGLLGDLAEKNAQSPEKVIGIIQRLQALSRRSGDAARYCCDLIESDGLFNDLIGDMRKTSSRMMSDIDHSLFFEGETQLQNVSSQNRIDLFLFYKECLINILRHSGATEARTDLIGKPTEVQLIVTDNGRGLQGSIGDRVPSSLSRRARLLGAKVSVEELQDHGTRVTLQLRTRRFRWWPSRRRVS